MNIQPWWEVCKRKIPRRLHVLSERLEIPGGERHASGTVTLQLTCFSMEQRSYWLVFINKKVGDFIVKIVSKACEPAATQLGCQQVTSTPPCDRICHVEVPCRDAAMWSAVSNTFEQTLTDPERNFWSTHLRTNIGLHLLNWILVNDGEDANYNEIKHLFVKRQTYQVSVTPSDNIAVDPTLLIEGNKHIFNTCFIFCTSVYNENINNLKLSTKRLTRSDISLENKLKTHLFLIGITKISLDYK